MKNILYKPFLFGMCAIGGGATLGNTSCFFNNSGSSVEPSLNYTLTYNKDGSGADQNPVLNYIPHFGIGSERTSLYTFNFWSDNVDFISRFLDLSTFDIHIMDDPMCTWKATRSIIDYGFVLQRDTLPDTARYNWSFKFSIEVFTHGEGACYFYMMVSDHKTHDYSNPLRLEVFFC